MPENPPTPDAPRPAAQGRSGARGRGRRRGGGTGRAERAGGPERSGGPERAGRRGPRSPERDTPAQREARARRREQAQQARRAGLDALTLTFPEDLPVSARREEIAAAIRDHQVVVVAGETGSGKTTQLPKICLELGRGVDGLIGHTQPRRIAARAVAERVAEELDVELGGAVGYQVRFTDVSSAGTLVKVMTDGVLLNELQRDRDLRRYDTIIIDEAHERSLNIDFLLGYLRRLLPRRPDLKVVITSATIDPHRFARHFDVGGSPAPVVEVSGRTYPVEIRYRPLVRSRPSRKPGGAPEDVEIDQVTGICEAVEELWTEAAPGHDRDGAGTDILVFCSGEREIRDAAEALTGLNLPATEILPLFGRLSAAEQHRVFERRAAGTRRIVVSTNVAETSLTVPGIRYVVDTGTARISRYSQRTKVQRLPIEPISRASADQRSGRCGRVADGIAVRLYSQEDLEARPRFTDPEILRTNLASVILQMSSLGLGEVASFPFVEKPDPRMVTDGVRLLHELGAIDPQETDPRRRLTGLGRKIARIPADPRLARMLLAADGEGALDEVIVIAAALSLQDVRERPADAQTQADQAHARFRDDRSDFVGVLNLWQYLRDLQREVSGSAFRRRCKAEYLHYLRVREWQDLVSQFRSVAGELGLRRNSGPASPDAVHRALLTGLLSQVGLRDHERRDYLGARGARFAIQPGSALFRKPPDWVMSAELVETSRLWARVNAVTDPAWVEAAAGHLVKRQYSEPTWSRKRAGAVAKERVTLYGVPLAADRPVAFGSIDPAASRDLFIRHALVDGDWDTTHRFFHDNRALIDRLADLESRARRRDILVDDETLVEFYDERLPAEVVSGAHFDTWWKAARREHPDLLTFTEDLVLSEAGDEAVSGLEGDYPHVWTQDELRLRLTYQFEPGADADGVTVHIPIEHLNQVRDVGFDWLVPGLRAELATALVRSLPKTVRKNFVPAPDRAGAALVQADPANGSLVDELARGLYIATGHRVPPDAWDPSRLPDHLRITFRVEGPARRVLGEGKDLADLQERLAPQVATTVSQAAARAGLERSGLRAWDFEALPDTFEQRRGERSVRGFPALVDTGDAVDVRVLPSAQEQRDATRLGVRRLLLLNTTVPWKRILGLLTNAQRLALGNNPHGGMQELLDDCLAAAVDAIAARAPGGVHDREAFEDRLAAVRREVVPTVIEIVELVHPVLDRALAVRLELDRAGTSSTAALRRDLESQLAGLVYPGFVADTGLERLRHLPRYLAGMLERLEKGPADIARDAAHTRLVADLDAARTELVASLPAADRTAPDVVALRWRLEELRVSLFAQRLGTAAPVSEKRIRAELAAARAAHARTR
ncbi:ATP-dependent RNA helicase HrpA [Agilicoccus flavus]|uniref:ATP-dependent RNA helicase HrpA n=1 Tax=Agilicoccus flavus TaxID=2775968 RepID=UPI001CF62E2E|nr:ATP-dependent RNA helicase HrpA [Agilicoccus flavus]